MFVSVEHNVIFSVRKGLQDATRIRHHSGRVQKRPEEPIVVPLKLRDRHEVMVHQQNV